MKKYWILGMIPIAFIFLLAGCGKNGAENTEKKAVKPVAVLELREESEPLLLHYTGTVEAKEIKKYSFLTAGKIAEVFVEEGQPIRKGDKLALLEQEDIDVTQLNVDKARANYDFVKDYYEKVRSLRDAGAVSQQDFQKAALEMEQAEYSLEQAQKILEITRNNALISADSDGYVLSVISRKDVKL